MDNATLVTIGIALGLPAILTGAYFLVITLAKKNIDFAEIAPETGLIVKKGGDVANILFNSEKGHYRRDGQWTNQKQDLGIWHDLTGRTFFGITPIYEIFPFDIKWSTLAAEESDASGRKKPPKILEKSECAANGFKRFYTHAVPINGAEMGAEGTGGETDSSTTRIDAALLVTIEITNIRDAIYRIDPQAVSFKQADAAIEGAFNDYVKGRHWEKFRMEDKISQSSAFVQHIRTQANPVLNTLGIGMQITVVELKFHDLTASPENEELALSQTKLAIAENEGNAEVARAKLHKQARKIEGEGEAEALTEVSKVIGSANIPAYANLGLVAKSQLRVFNQAGSKGKVGVTAIVGTEDK